MALETYTFEAGALYRGQFRRALNSLRLRYIENAGLLESVFVVKAYTDADLQSLESFKSFCRVFKRQLDSIDRQEREEQAKVERAKRERKLARKNFFRKLTFRKTVNF